MKGRNDICQVQEDIAEVPVVREDAAREALVGQDPLWVADADRQWGVGADHHWEVDTGRRWAVAPDRRWADPSLTWAVDGDTDHHPHREEAAVAVCFRWL